MRSVRVLSSMWRARVEAAGHQRPVARPIPNGSSTDPMTTCFGSADRDLIWRPQRD